MILLLHVSIAILSMVQATYTLVSPSRRRLRSTNGLIVATLASGTYLVWSTHSPLLQSCATGLMYLAVVTVLSVAARHRLVKARAKM